MRRLDEAAAAARGARSQARWCPVRAGRPGRRGGRRRSGRPGGTGSGRAGPGPGCGIRRGGPSAGVHRRRVRWDDPVDVRVRDGAADRVHHGADRGGHRPGCAEVRMWSSMWARWIPNRGPGCWLRIRRTSGEAGWRTTCGCARSSGPGRRPPPVWAADIVVGWNGERVVEPDLESPSREMASPSPPTANATRPLDALVGRASAGRGWTRGRRPGR